MDKISLKYYIILFSICLYLLIVSLIFNTVMSSRKYGYNYKKPKKERNLKKLPLLAMKKKEKETKGSYMGTIITKIMNGCLLVKWIWKIFHEPDEPWFRILKAKIHRWV